MNRRTIIIGVGLGETWVVRSCQEIHVVASCRVFQSRSALAALVGCFFAVTKLIGCGHGDVVVAVLSGGGRVSKRRVLEIVLVARIPENIVKRIARVIQK